MGPWEACSLALKETASEILLRNPVAVIIDDIDKTNSLVSTCYPLKRVL